MTEQTKLLQTLLADAGAFGFGVCPFRDDLLLPNVRSASRLPQNAKSIIACVFPYYTGYHRNRNLAKYAMVPDYHKVVGELLAAACQRLSEYYKDYSFIPFVDASPIDEVKAAVRAGLGVLGENHMLITEQFGSYCFIGEIVTDLPIDCEVSEGVCIRCGRCLRGCPTEALSRDGVDQARCRSAITQKKGQLTAEEQAQIAAGKLAWGCDICNDVCPMNKKAQQTVIEGFGRVTPVITAETLDEVFTDSAFAWRGKETMLRNLDLLNPK